jgi:hypothetical protein
MISEKREIVKNLGEFICRQCLQSLQKLFSLGFGQHVDNLACLLWISNPAFLLAWFHRFEYPTGSSPTGIPYCTVLDSVAPSSGDFEPEVAIFSAR